MFWTVSLNKILKYKYVTFKKLLQEYTYIPENMFNPFCFKDYMID